MAGCSGHTHITEIKERVTRLSRGRDVVVVEIGGTVGDVKAFLSWKPHP